MVDGENDNTGYVIRLASALRCVLRFMHFKRSLMILMITIVADFRSEYMLLHISNQFSIQSLDNLSDGHSDVWYLYWFESFESICVQIKILKFTWKSIIFCNFFHFLQKKKKSTSAFHITNISNENNKITNGLDSVYLRCKRIINVSKSWRDAWTE